MRLSLPSFSGLSGIPWWARYQTHSILTFKNCVSVQSSFFVMLHAVIRKYSIFLDIIMQPLKFIKPLILTGMLAVSYDSLLKFKISFQAILCILKVNIGWGLFIHMLSTIHIVLGNYKVQMVCTIIYIVFIVFYCWCGYINFSCLREIWTNWL